ncbi:MAG TPA: hypothetical protein VNQ56_14170 [Pseudolabrys sp.]|nr:hypothetical protein [Pseudolabrys sp.]
MVRVLNAVAALLAAAVWGLPAAASVPAPLSDRTLPMRFELRQDSLRPDGDLRQDAAVDACAKACRRWVAATGVITADTPRDFLAFAEGKDIRGATLALDSDGGSVLGALAFGRAVRALDMTTTVGRSAGHGRLDPHADCESMCAFVLLAGVRRHVPEEAGVLVHQIWIGDRRDDPTAATYSAEDLVLVQRDIGRIAQYLADMGASPEVLDLALRIPPWEPMHRLSRDELRRLRVVTTDRPFDGPAQPLVAHAASSKQTTSVQAIPAGAPAADGLRIWRLLDDVGGAALTRRHPLTLEGDEIGTFDVTFACGPGPDRYLVSYSEWRRAAHALPRSETASPQVKITIGRFSIPLTVSAAAPSDGDYEADLFASGTVPDEAMQAFADLSGRSLTVSTTGAGIEKTSIRIGNTGFARSLPQLTASCEAMAARQQARSSPARPPLKPGTLVQAGDLTRN